MQFEKKKNHYSGSIGISLDSAKSKKSMAEFVELAHTLEKNDGNKSHVVTIKFMESWHQFGKNVVVRNQVNFFHKIETGHFMSCGKVSKIPGDFILDELTHQCLHPKLIGTNNPISSRMIVQLGEQSYEIPSAVYLNVRPQSVLANCTIPGSNKIHLSERDEAWCKKYFGIKFNGLTDQCRGHDKYSKSSIDDDMMNNIYSNCIVAFKLRAVTTRNKFNWRLLYVKFDLAKEIKNWPITLDDDFIQKKAPW